MGWTPFSRMTKVYAHLSDEDVDRVILETQGVKVKSKKETCQNGLGLSLL